MSLNTTYFETKGRDITTPIPDTPSYTPPSPPTPPTPGGGSVPSIPSTTFDGSVVCELYYNSSENNKLDKTLTSVLSTTVMFKDKTDLINPYVILDTSTDLTNCNYMKLNDKYYFISSIECLPGGLFGVTGHVDVLMTYRDQIRNQTGLIKRNLNQYNRFLHDERIQLNAYKQTKTLKFSSGFSKTLNYYLVAIGGA